MSANIRGVLVFRCGNLLVRSAAGNKKRINWKLRSCVYCSIHYLISNYIVFLVLKMG